MRHKHSLFAYCGGKTRVVKHLVKYKPETFNGYMEPFVGAGSLLAALGESLTGDVIINDINPFLINLYSVIKQDVHFIIDILALIPIEEHIFYFMRDNGIYETLKMLGYEEKVYNAEENKLKAVEFMYLINNSYGSKWVINKAGKLAITYKVKGNKRKPKKLPDIPNLLYFNSILQKVTILCEDFERVIVNHAKSGMFVYCDPPYIPTTPFSRIYTQTPFSFEDQIRLKELVDLMTKKGVHVMVSNSYTDKTLELYKDYNIHLIEIPREMISKYAGKEGRSVKEVIITNY